MIRSLLILLFFGRAVGQTPSLCQGSDPWLGHGACIANDAPTLAEFGWHCPWEASGLVSGYGCSNIKYDCADTAMINTLLGYYEANGVITGSAQEWDNERLKYSYNCIIQQCAIPKPIVATSWIKRRLVTV
mmetsp:Transcript_39462/g.62617  ORF Transcript_39462/g.62617 Transcript_39462/m.62617 type:complete len:131 (-) Transcript_39462:143-535(-)